MKAFLALVLLVTAARGEDWFTDQLAERMARLALAARSTERTARAPRVELQKIMGKLAHTGDARAVPFLAPLLAEPGETVGEGDVLYGSTSSTAADCLDMIHHRNPLPNAPTTFPLTPAWRAWWQAHRANYQVPAALAALEASSPPAPVTPEITPVTPKVTPQATPPPAPAPTPESPPRHRAALLFLLGLLAVVAGYGVRLWVKRRARP